MDKLLQECLVVCDCENDAVSLIDVAKDHNLWWLVMPKHISACSVTTGSEYRVGTLKGTWQFVEGFIPQASICRGQAD